MTISNEILDKLLEDYNNPEDLLGQNGIMVELKKRLIERVMDAEMTDHLGYEKHATEGRNNGNGHSSKKIISDKETIEVDIPRDREGDFEPQLIRKHQRRFDGFDDKIISMYSHGMTTRDIQHHLKDMYNVDVSPTLISQVTDSVIDDVRAWQSRPLDPYYPINLKNAVENSARGFLLVPRFWWKSLYS